MTHSPAAVLRAWLVTQSLVTAAESPGSWPCAVGREPDAGTDNVATLYDTAGTKQGRALDGSSGLHVFKHGVALRVRASDRATGWTKAEAIADAVKVIRGRNTTDQVTLSTSTYRLHNVSQQAPTRHVPNVDQKRREVHTADFLVSVVQES